MPFVTTLRVAHDAFLSTTAPCAVAMIPAITIAAQTTILFLSRTFPAAIDFDLTLL